MRRTLVTVVVLLGVLPSSAHANPGQLDRFFSRDGKQTAFAHGATGYAVVIDKHDRIVVAGYTLDAKTNIALARFLPNGAPDPSFGGGDGRVTTDLGATDYAFDVALQKDGRIVVAGERDQADASQVAVVRYGIAGKLDRTFSRDGRAFTTFGKAFQGANAVTVGRSGNILVGGFTSNGTTSRWAMARYKPNGSLDRGFGRKGRVTVDLSPTDEQIEDLAVVAGRIVASGYAEASLVPRFAVARFLPGGKLDRGFAHKGTNLVDLSKGGDTGYAMAVQRDGRIVVVGYADHRGSGDWGIVRFGSEGRLDPTFSGDGKQITAFGPGYEYAYGVAVQPNGKILAVGRVIRRNGDFCIVRYKPGGGADIGFGGDGRSCTDFFGGEDTGRDIALQANGKIVTAGESVRGPIRRLAVVRFLAS